MTHFVEIFVEGYPKHNYPILVDVSKISQHLTLLDKGNKVWKLGKFITS